MYCNLVLSSDPSIYPLIHLLICLFFSKKKYNGKYSRNGHNPNSYHHYHQRSDPRQYHSASVRLIQFNPLF